MSCRSKEDFLEPITTIVSHTVKRACKKLKKWLFFMNFFNLLHNTVKRYLHFDNNIEVRAKMVLEKQLRKKYLSEFSPG